MSGHPQGGHYEDGYGHHPQPRDSYYQEDNQAYYDTQQGYQQQPHGTDSYYDES